MPAHLHAVAYTHSDDVSPFAPQKKGIQSFSFMTESQLPRGKERGARRGHQFSPQHTEREGPRFRAEKNPILEKVCLNRNGFDQSDYSQETTRPALTLVPCLVAVLTRRLAARKGVNQRGSNSVQGQWPNFSLSTKSNLVPYTRHRCTLAVLQSRRVLGR